MAWSDAQYGLRNIYIGSFIFLQSDTQSDIDTCVGFLQDQYSGVASLKVDADFIPCCMLGSRELSQMSARETNSELIETLQFTQKEPTGLSMFALKNSTPHVHALARPQTLDSFDLYFARPNGEKVPVADFQVVFDVYS